jgi:hypothetical protein
MEYKQTRSGQGYWSLRRGYFDETVGPKGADAVGKNGQLRKDTAQFVHIRLVFSD